MYYSRFLEIGVLYCSERFKVAMGTAGATVSLFISFVADFEPVAMWFNQLERIDLGEHGAYALVNLRLESLIEVGLYGKLESLSFP